VLRPREVNDDGVHPHIGHEERGAEIDDAPRVLVKQVEQVPRREAVEAEDPDQPDPGGPREGVKARVDVGVVEERAGRDEDEAEQPQAWNDLRVQLDQPRPLAPIRFGGIDLEIE
jgi:hypothetical protein